MIEDSLVSDRIAQDADWYQISFPNQVEVLARLESLLVGGDLDLKL